MAHSVLLALVFSIVGCVNGFRRQHGHQRISESLSSESDVSAAANLNTKALVGFSVNSSADGQELPIPRSMYHNMHNVSCPFQRWTTSALPPNFASWESALVSKYVDTWKAEGSPRGVNENDHNYNTLLGQGNTLGFVAARITLDRVPDEYKYGLFANSGPFRAIVRFSDFGDDSTSIRFGRMAVKVQMESAWASEVNLLTTESMDSFPIANFGQLGVFAGDVQNKLATARYGGGLAKNVLEVLGVKNFDQVIKGGAFKEHLLAKHYYSQLPYQLGNKAMKFSFKPKQQTCGDPGVSSPCCLPVTEPMAEGFAADRSGATASFLEHCDAHFDIQLQVKAFSTLARDWFNDDIIYHRGHESWQEELITVGTLTIPRQQCSADAAVGAKLQSDLSSALGVEVEGVDKMFAFHPVMTHDENRPIGDINTFRNAFYSQHAAARFQTIQRGMLNDDGGHGLSTVKQMPFDMLDSTLFGM